MNGSASLTPMDIFSIIATVILSFAAAILAWLLARSRPAMQAHATAR